MPFHIWNFIEGTDLETSFRARSGDTFQYSAISDRIELSIWKVQPPFHKAEVDDHIIIISWIYVEVVLDRTVVDNELYF